MRKYMNIINRLLFGAVALAALSCTGNFETYNRNPDQPSTIDRDVWNYIKSMQYNVIPTVKNQYQIVENVSGGAYGRYFAYAKSTDAGWNTGMFAFYRIANDWANPPYEVPMTNIYSNWRPSRPNSKSRKTTTAWRSPRSSAWRPCSASPTFRGPFPTARWRTTTT